MSPTDRIGNPLDPRTLQVLNGEAKLRTHLPDEAALNSICHFDHFSDEWLVRVKIWPYEGASAIEIGPEKLDEFPSELMIAQAMLVA